MNGRIGNKLNEQDRSDLFHKTETNECKNTIHYYTNYFGEIFDTTTSTPSIKNGVPVIFHRVDEYDDKINQ